MAGLIAIVVLGLALLPFALVRHSQAYEVATEHARHHPDVTGAIGTIEHFGFFGSFSVRVSGDSGWAWFALKACGERGRAKLYYALRKRRGQWTITQLVIDGPAGRMQLLG